MPLVVGHQVLCLGSLGTLEEAVVWLMGGDVYVFCGEDHNGDSPQVAEKSIHNVSVEGKLWPFEHRLILGKDDRGKTEPDAPIESKSNKKSGILPAFKIAETTTFVS